jgi:hypothetical protein
MFDVVSAKLDKKDGSALSLKEFIRSLLDETNIMCGNIESLVKEKR